MPSKFYFEPPIDTDLNTIIEAFADVYKYKETIENPDYNPDDINSTEFIPNPITKEEFMVSIVENFFVEVDTAYRAKQFDNGLITPEEYVLGREEYLKTIKTMAFSKVNIVKEII